MNKCPKCGYSKDKNEPFNKMMDRVLRESAERMKKQMGYGIPEEPDDVAKHDHEDLGSTITGIWRQNDNQKDN